MEKHEARCTLNPKRRCGVCKMLLEMPQTDIADLMAILPDPAGRRVKSTYNEGFYLPEEFEEEVDLAIPKLREAANFCPLCMLAALRQKGVPATMAKSLKVKEVMASIWSDANDNDSGDYGPY